MNNRNEFLPIRVGRDKKETWYLDVSRLSLCELLELRKELFMEEDTIVVLDSIIQANNNVYVNNKRCYTSKGNGYVRECKKEKKNERIKLKKRTKEKRGLIIND